MHDHDSIESLFQSAATCAILSVVFEDEVATDAEADRDEEHGQVEPKPEYFIPTDESEIFLPALFSKLFSFFTLASLFLSFDWLLLLLVILATLKIIRVLH